MIGNMAQTHSLLYRKKSNRRFTGKRRVAQSFLYQRAKNTGFGNQQ